MFADIENGIIQRLEFKGLPVRKLKVGSNKNGIIAPSIYTYIESGTFSRSSKDKLKVNLSVFVTLVFKNLKNEEQRRKGAYPIITGVLLALAFSDLGLKSSKGNSEITPLVPASFHNITDEVDVKASQIVFEIEFSTGFYIDTTEEDLSAELLKIGLEHYLQDPSDDGIKDAEDIVTLT